LTAEYRGLELDAPGQLADLGSLPPEAEREMPSLVLGDETKGYFSRPHIRGLCKVGRAAGGQ
jgi:hypothetical protein